MQGPCKACFAAQRTMKLKLENVGKEIARVGDVCGDVILRSWIEVSLATLHGRRHALILALQVPPGLVVIRRRNLPGEDFPAPLVNQQAKRKKRHFVQGAMQEETDVGRSRGHGIEQIYLLQGSRC